MGGESYELRVPNRTSFDADAGEDVEVTNQDSVTLSADPINEPAIYNWYDDEGYLVHTGEDFTVSADVSAIFMLEVIALSDGFKDYDNIEIEVNENYILSFAPNPADAFLNVDYVIESGQNAFIVLLNLQNGTSNQYLIDPQLNTTQLNTASLQNGNYTMILFVDGVPSDNRNIIIQ